MDDEEIYDKYFERKKNLKFSCDILKTEIAHLQYLFYNKGFHDGRQHAYDEMDENKNLTSSCDEIRSDNIINNLNGEKPIQDR